MTTDGTPAAFATSATRVDLEPLRPRVSTIVWGTILLGIAVLAALGELGQLDELPNGSLPIILIAGVGGLLVIAAIVGGITAAGRRDDAELRRDGD